MLSNEKKTYPPTRVMSGFLELLPEEQIEFDKIKTIIADTFKSFGFTELDTPIIERLEVLYAKDVGETSTQVYELSPRGEDKDSKSGLRFDLTVPLARYVAQHFTDLSYPFRRYHIAKVYRGERAQKGRYREFYQCDVDIIGHNTLSGFYDAEIPCIIYQLFKKLNFGKFTIRINNRKLLNGLIESLECSASSDKILGVIDKIEKISKEEVIKQLKDLELSDAMIDTLNRFIDIKGSNADVLRNLRDFGVKNENYLAGLQELAMITNFLSAYNIDDDYYRIDPVVVRGLNYYTGTVYETILDNYPGLGSVCGGGRYDNLAEQYTKEKLPGVGISIGLTRLFCKLKEIGIVKCTKKTIADIIIIPKEDADITSALSISQDMRNAGFNADVLLETYDMKKKFAYVNKKDTLFTIVIDSNKDKQNEATLQYKTADGTINKQTVPINELAEAIKKLR